MIQIPIEKFDCDKCGNEKEYTSALTEEDLEHGISSKMRYLCPRCDMFEEDE